MRPAVEHAHLLEVTALVPSTVPELTLLCLSDTHDQQDFMLHPLPRADVLIHAGDFSCRGSREEVANFIKWSDRLLDDGLVRYIVFVCGNHELNMQLSAKSPAVRQAQEDMKRALIDRDNVYYMQDSMCVIEGLRFYGSPWTTKFGDHWAFQLPDTEDIDHGLGGKFKSIPEGVQVLVTHQPPLGQGDHGDGNRRHGSRALLQRVLEVEPLVHVFGHIHSGYGASKREDLNTIFVNAAVCDDDYQPDNKPVLIKLQHAVAAESDHGTP
ncbi:hypothetical protein CYMTET_7766 [Cymbomonas tetramitiformis]|uniref:Calcineurin-like phosphoesterase domain-containing protein n=1 Tax=Cymbomonas tetramitiformis TaxID=36881 RepID=A0AAE0LGR7_9CHLO|nr:hypothetical protein CYMTET_7766 [Cymbomonas tetramitiformis]|eukprot:gene19134-22878_t